MTSAATAHTSFPPASLLPRAVPALPPAARRALTTGVLAAHGLGIFGLMQVEPVRQAVAAVVPLQVEWLNPPPPATPPTAPPPPPAAPRPPPPRPLPAPVPRLVSTEVAAPAPFTVPALPPEPLPSAAPAPTAAAVPAAPAAPPAPPPSPPAPSGPMKVAAGALQYTTLPPVEVPRQSRRLGESGTVVVRVVVDLNGLPRVVALHRSSGFERLDAQALGAMRAARFKPCLREGQPVECEALAPIAYELEH